LLFLIRYFTIAPPPQLAKYVRYFWVLEGEIAGPAPYIHRTMASGCPELFFHYRGIFNELLPSGKIRKSVAAGISGPAQQFNRFSIKENFGMFGAYLYPFSIPLFFNMPAAELVDQMPDLINLLGYEGRLLEEQMMIAAGNQQRVQILSALLEKKLQYSKEDKGIFSCISHIIHSKENTGIQELAGKYFLSAKQLERRFKTYCGFSPKLFSRITRFQSALEFYSNKSKSLTGIAYECGYYDQSHFIHDFKVFSGYNPKQYFSGKAEGVEWRDA
jgi:AraC-like DNA-binding protein